MGHFFQWWQASLLGLVVIGESLSFIPVQTGIKEIESRLYSRQIYFAERVNIAKIVAESDQG